MKLVLIGLRGTGKSTVGRLLARRLEKPFFDTDALLQERAGMTIREIFAQHGEPHFRQLEAQIVRECAANADAVIATGGGAVLNKESASALKRDGFVVHLSASPKTLWKRISSDEQSHATRPQLVSGVNSGLEELTKLMLARAAVYAETRDVEVTVEDRTPEEVADAVQLLMRTHGVLPASTARNKAVPITR